MPADTQNALAGLRRWSLVRDDSGPHRVYRDESGKSYASVTHILKETSPQWQKDALDRWIQKPGSALERDIACQRGTLAHDHAEYVLKQQRNSRVIALTSEEAGGLEMTAWNVPPRESLPGPSKSHSGGS